MAGESRSFYKKREDFTWSVNMYFQGMDAWVLTVVAIRPEAKETVTIFQFLTFLFSFKDIPPPPLLMDTAPKEVTIHAGDRRYRFETAWPKTILQATLDNHIPLPYSCKGGRCSSCLAKCTKGGVKMSINEVLTDKDIKEGLVLTCVGYAETEVVLDLPV